MALIADKAPQHLERKAADASGPLAYALETGLFSDVTLQAAGSSTIHKCHRVVLGSIQYFRDALTKHVEEGPSRASASRSGSGEKEKVQGHIKSLVLSISEEAVGVLLRFVYQVPFDDLSNSSAAQLLAGVEELAMMGSKLVATLWGFVEGAMLRLEVDSSEGSPNNRERADLLGRYIEAAATLRVKHGITVPISRVGVWIPWRVARSIGKEAIVCLVAGLGTSPDLGMLWALAWCAVHPALTHADFDGLFGAKGIVSSSARLPGKATLASLLSHCQSQLVTRYVLSKLLGVSIPLMPTLSPAQEAVVVDDRVDYDIFTTSRNLQSAFGAYASPAEIAAAHSRTVNPAPPPFAFGVSASSLPEAPFGAAGLDVSVLEAPSTTLPLEVKRPSPPAAGVRSSEERAPPTPPEEILRPSPGGRSLLEELQEDAAAMAEAVELAKREALSVVAMPGTLESLVDDSDERKEDEAPPPPRQEEDADVQARRERRKEKREKKGKAEKKTRPTTSLAEE
jgi:hypothetical protein